MTKPVFISIQRFDRGPGGYLLNLTQITSIEIHVDEEGIPTDYKVTTSDGNEVYTVNDPDEMSTLMDSIRIVGSYEEEI